METTYYLNDKPVQIIGRENSREVWVETATGEILRVYKRGLNVRTARKVTALRIDGTRGTDGAR